MKSTGSGLCVCLWSYWSSKIPHRAAHLAGTPWRTVTCMRHDPCCSPTPLPKHQTLNPRWRFCVSSSLCILGAFSQADGCLIFPLVLCYLWVCCTPETKRHEGLTPKSSYVIHLASFFKPDYSIQGKRIEEKSGIHRGYTEKVIFCVCLSWCFEKALEHVHLTPIWKPLTCIFSFPLCLATAQKKLSEISLWRWHLWVVGLKLMEASCSRQQTASVAPWPTWECCRFMVWCGSSQENKSSSVAAAGTGGKSTQD